MRVCSCRSHFQQRPRKHWTANAGGRTCGSWPTTDSRGAAKQGRRALEPRGLSRRRVRAGGGLKPAGTDGYFQAVHLRSREIDESHCSLSLVRSTSTDSLTLGEDAIISVRVDPAPVVNAELVFVGYGLAIPEADHDDFAGLDVRGKVVVALRGAPPSIPGPLAAHMQSSHEWAALLKRRGAIGFATIQNPKNMDIPWGRLKPLRFMPSMSLADPALDETRGLKIAITINPAQADRWLSGTGHTFQEILDAADAGKPLPRFAIPGPAERNRRRETSRHPLPERRCCVDRVRPPAQERVRGVFCPP